MQMKNEVVGDNCVVGGEAVDGVYGDAGRVFARRKKTQASCLRCIWVAGVIAGVLTAEGAGFAERALSYASGTGFTAGYTNAASALGEPSRVTPGMFGGPVDPFSPPYLSEQLVSVGAGGHLTLQFDSQVLDNSANPFGIDFTIFGNSGFVITNGDFSGGGITDGSLFGANSGETRVSVSADGTTFFELSPSLAPVVDGPFPTDGSGDFHTPLNPGLTKEAFSGKSLAEIRALYNGSAGGAGYDIAWARDGQGQPVSLGAIQYVRVDVLSGAAEIDGIAVTVPEPGTWTLMLGGLAGWALIRRKKG